MTDEVETQETEDEEVEDTAPETEEDAVEETDGLLLAERSKEDGTKHF